MQNNINSTSEAITESKTKWRPLSDVYLQLLVAAIISLLVNVFTSLSSARLSILSLLSSTISALFFALYSKEKVDTEKQILASFKEEGIAGIGNYLERDNIEDIKWGAVKNKMKWFSYIGSITLLCGVIFVILDRRNQEIASSDTQKISLQIQEKFGKRIDNIDSSIIIMKADVLKIQTDLQNCRKDRDKHLKGGQK